MRGTALRPFLLALAEPEAAKFVDAFAERMAVAYSPQANAQISPSAASFWSHSASQVEIFHSPSTYAAALSPVHMSHFT
jgi:hypothetical protein